MSWSINRVGQRVVCVRHHSLWGGVSSSDRALYIKNLHDSGYNTKENFTASGNIKG